MYRILFRKAAADTFYSVDRTAGDLEGALTVAQRLLAEGNVVLAILDIKGKQISGETLMACCRGETKISIDLFAR
jgi:hypothetical protein